MALPYATVGQLLKLEEKLSKSSGGSTGSSVSIIEATSREKYVEVLKLLSDKLDVFPEYLFDFYAEEIELTEAQQEELLNIAKSEVKDKSVILIQNFFLPDFDDYEFTAEDIGISQNKYKFLKDLILSQSRGNNFGVKIRDVYEGTALIGWDYIAFNLLTSDTELPIFYVNEQTEKIEVGMESFSAFAYAINYSYDYEPNQE